MTAPLIQGASGIEGEKLTYASTNENNMEIYTFTANEPVTWSISGGEKDLFSIEKDTGKLSFIDVPDYETIKNLNGATLEFILTFQVKVLVKNSLSRFTMIKIKLIKLHLLQPITLLNM